MNNKDFKYSENHIWAIWDGSNNSATIGLSDYAQSQLGEILWFELPGVGTMLNQSEKMGEVESLKAVAELLSPVSGEVTKINQAVLDTPYLVNEDPYGSGWLVELRLNRVLEIESLMTSEQYEEFVARENPEGKA